LIQRKVILASLNRTLISFGEFELDPAGYELKKRGRRVKLQRIPMEILLLLIDRPGELVLRGDLSRVWQSDDPIDTERSINTAIRKLRQALGDEAEHPRFVETVAGKGYRFIADVSKSAKPILETTKALSSRAKHEVASATAPSQKLTVADAVPQIRAGRYRFIAKLSSRPSLSEPAPALKTPPPAIVENPAPPQRPWPRLTLAALVSALATAVLIASRGLTVRKAEPLTISPFTALRGLQAWPAFSPDGGRVAFGWTGETGSCSHIYVKDVDRASLAQLTEGPSCDSSPSWSRDGGEISFLRKEAAGEFGLYIVHASGGASVRIAGARSPAGYRPAWSPDGKTIVIMDSDGQAPPSLSLVSIDSGEKWRITKTESTGTGDWCPAFSPDGRTLAYLHNTGSFRLSPLYLLPVDRTGNPAGDPKRVETGSSGFTDFDWSADGRSLIAATPSGLVRVRTSGGAPETLPFPDGGQPAVAPRLHRMVYLQKNIDTDIFRVPGARGSGPVTRLISSTRLEFSGQYSSDGARIAFVSDRTGSEEIWVADSEGRGSRQITRVGGPSVGSPRWSPDGKWIAFDSTLAGRPGIYVIGADGEGLRRVTSVSNSSVRPSWSHDGAWLYFGSDQSGNWQIWKIQPGGGPPLQLTQNGGREAFEDPDGEFLFYTKEPPMQGIWRLPLNTGSRTRVAEHKVSEAGRQGRWGLGHRALYYVNPPNILEFLELSANRSLPIALPGLSIGEDASNVLGASPDDRWVLLSVPIRSDVGLMLVRNFQ
jgi:Tol biopolymer transport system component/DNA-binding winged helix-turn-helix (wHTH) protein